jgi:protein TonB
MSEFPSKWHAVGLAGSLAVHLGAYGVLGAAHQVARASVGPSVVEFELPPAPPPVAEPPEAPEAEPDDEVAPTVPAAPREPPPELAPEPLPDEAPSEDPVELTGLTLTNDGPGEGWASQVGNGQAMQGPIRRATRRPEPGPKSDRGEVRPASVRRVPRPKEPELVPIGSLSRRPAPPPLNGKLVSNYPPDARRRGQEGIAVVTARIEADGRIRVASVASESAPGFGEACRNTVIGSVWSPPLDESGRAVATQVRYTCQFRVER